MTDIIDISLVKIIKHWCLLMQHSCQINIHYHPVEQFKIKSNDMISIAMYFQTFLSINTSLFQALLLCFHKSHHSSFWICFMQLLIPMLGKWCPSRRELIGGNCVHLANPHSQMDLICFVWYNQSDRRKSCIGHHGRVIQLQRLCPTT